MALSRNDAQSNARNYDPIEPGAHPMRLCRVYDLGVQERTWQGDTKRANEIYVVFEVLDAFMNGEDGEPDETKPRVMGRFVRLYKGAKKGTEIDFCRALDPRNEYGGNWAAMAAARLPCFGQVENNEKDGVIKDKLAALSAIPKGFALPEGQVEIHIFDLDNPDREIWEKMPDFLKETIQQRVKEGTPPQQYKRTEAEAKAAPAVPAPKAPEAPAAEAQADAPAPANADAMADVKDDIPW